MEGEVEISSLCFPTPGLQAHANTPSHFVLFCSVEFGSDAAAGSLVLALWPRWLQLTILIPLIRELLPSYRVLLQREEQRLKRPQGVHESAQIL